MSLIRKNLMTQPGYTPYCGADACFARWPRTKFDGEQFRCVCGWQSKFDAIFITEYKAKWKPLEALNKVVDTKNNP